MEHRMRLSRLAVPALALVALPLTAAAQQAGWRANPEVVQKTSAARPGFNFTESGVGSYTLPDALAFHGTEVKTPAEWRARRAEILDLFRENVYGRSPGRPEHLRFKVLEEDPHAMGGAATLKRISVECEQSGREYSFEFTLFLPNARPGRVPVFLLLNNRGPSNTDPTRKEKSGFWPAEQMIARGYGMAALRVGQLAPDHNATFREGVIQLFEGTSTGPRPDDAWGALSAWAWGASRVMDYFDTDPTRKEKSGFWPAEQMIARGYGIAAFHYAELAPDNAQRYRDGVIGFFAEASTGAPPYTWRALAAWAWGASRAMDYFETDPRIDRAHVAVLGHSRGGKAALWAGAEDDRFALVISNESGEGGAALSRRNFGETITRINTTFPHWFTDAYKGFNDRAADLPVDQHMLLSLVAPRALYVGSADEDLWSDPRGEFLSLAASSPVFALWGDPAIRADDMPPLDTPLVRGRRGYHVRTGSHNLTPYDWDRFADFADRLWR
jgi:hypothetical protein